MLFQYNPVSGSDHSLGGQNTGCWASGDSFSPDKLGDCFAIVFRVRYRKRVGAVSRARRVQKRPSQGTDEGPGFGDDKWRWRVEAANGDGFRALRTHWSTRQYADITGNKSEAGTVVQASGWHLGSNQHWRFVPDQLYNIRSPINRDFALAGLPDRSLRMKRCTAAQAYTDPSVQWRLHRFTTGFLLIHPALSLIACVRLDDVKAGIRLHELDEGGPVRPGEWTLDRIAGDDRIYEVRLVFLQKRMRWDAYNAVIAEGTELWSHESNNGANQKWVFTINGSDGTVEPAF